MKASKQYFTIIFLLLFTLEAFPQADKQSGFFAIVEAGHLRPIGYLNYGSGVRFKNDAHVNRLRVSMGYFLSPHFSLAAGIGLDGYQPFRGNTMPIYLEGRGFLKREGETPFVLMNLGAAVRTSDIYETGWKGEWGIGKKILLGRVHMLTAVTLNAQQMTDQAYVLIDPINQTIQSGQGNVIRYSAGISVGVLLF